MYDWVIWRPPEILKIFKVKLTWSKSSRLLQRVAFLVNIKKTLNRSITKFYNGDDVNVFAAELRLTKTRPTSFYKKHNLL